MARRIEVELVGDSRQLERAFNRSSKAAKDFNRDIGRTLRGGIAGSGAFRSLGRSVAFASGAFLGGAGLVSTLKTSVDAASNLSEQISKTNQVFGDSAKAVQDWSRTSAKAMGLAQDQALETAGSFGALLRPLGLTGNEAANQSEKLTQLGSDLASFYNTSVTDALDAVRSGLVGESEPLRKYGVLLSETRVTQEALTETGKKNAKQLTQQEKVQARIALIYKDSALAQGDFQRTSGGLANQQRILTAQIRNLQIAIGNQLKPVILDVVSSISDWLSKSENQRQVTNAVKGAVDLLVGAFKAAKGALDTLNSITGSTKNSLKLLFAVFVGFKTVQLVSRLSDMSTSIAGIGTNAKKSAGQVRVLRGGLVGLGELGAIVVGITLLIENKTEIEGFFDRHLGFHIKPLKEYVKWLASHGPGLPGPRVPVIPPGTVAGGTRAPSQDPFAHARGAFAQAPPTLPTGGAGGRGGSPFTRAQRNAFFDARIGRMLTRAQYKELQGQLAVYRQVAALLTKRIATTKDITRKLKLEDELLSVQAQIKGTRAELAANAVQARADAAQARADKAEKARLAAERATARRQARQFRALGFGPGGEDIVPGVAALRKQLAGVRGMSGLTQKMRNQIAQIAKVLAGTWGKVGKDVRAKIAEMIKGWRDELKGDGQGPLTKWGVTNTDQMLRGLGLSREQRLVLQQRLARTGPGGTTPRRGGGLGGAFGLAAAGGVVITGPVTVVAQDPDELGRKLDRKKRRGAVSRSGPRAGQRGD